MFSFQIGVISQEEEGETSAESIALSDDVKVKLQETLQHLHQDIGQLGRNAKPIRAILENLEGQLPESIEEALTPAAYIESHRMQFLPAQKHLADRLQQEQIDNQRDDFKARAKSACAEIKSLNDAQAALQRNKAELEAKRDHLLQELNQVNQAIDIVDNDLSQIPSTITRLEGEKQEQTRQAYQLHKCLRPIPGSVYDNNRTIQTIDEICLRAIKVIQEALGSL